MSLYQIFDQFCLDFCFAWGIEASSSFICQALTIFWFGMCFCVGFLFYVSVFYFIYVLGELIFKSVKRYIIKSR